VARADATALPVRDASVPAALIATAHTDVDDYPAVLREVARVLAPGGQFLHIGVHPCFVGAFADRSDPRRPVLSDGYHDRHRRFDAWSPHGVRARVGATHLPLAALLTAFLDAGLTVTGVREAGPDGAYPDLLAVAARRPPAA
jgi:SAM-dependent methyltransferase